MTNPDVRHPSGRHSASKAHPPRAVTSPPHGLRRPPPRAGTKVRGLLQRQYDLRGSAKVELIQSYSPKMQREVVLAGKLHHRHQLLCESDPGLVEVDYAPLELLQRAGVMAITLTNDGVRQVRVLRTFRNASTRLLDATILRYAEECRNEALRKALTYRTVEVLVFDQASLERPEDQILLQNWNALIPYCKQIHGQMLDPYFNEIAVWLARVDAVTMQDLTACCLGGDDKQAKIKAAAIIGVATGRWTSDLHEVPLSPDTRFMAWPGGVSGAATAPRPWPAFRPFEDDKDHLTQRHSGLGSASPPPPDPGGGQGVGQDDLNPLQRALGRIVYAKAENLSVRNMPDYWRDLDHWPPFDEAVLRHHPPENVARFRRTKAAIENYLKTESLKQSAQMAQLHSSRLTDLFRKCLRKRKGTNQIWGWQALMLGERGGDYVRQGDPIPQASARGAAGAFEALLCREPTVLDALIKAIEVKFDPGEMTVSHQNAHGVYRKFRAACVTAGITRDEYPLHTANAGLQSVRRFINEYLEGHVGCYGYWYGQGAADKLRVGTGKRSLPLEAKPYDLVMMDAHHVDVVGSIWVRTANGPKKVAIRRVWLVVLYCAVSGAVVSYSLSYELQVTAEDIERAFVRALTPWRPRALSRGLCYHKGAGLPHGVVEGLVGCPIVTLRMDNFTSNYANAIREKARAVLGFHANYGPVRQWFTNARLERFFETVESSGLHVLPSSTGTGTQDLFAAEDPAREAIANDVDASFIEDLIEVLLTGENVRPSPVRDDMSPLEIMRNLLLKREWLPRCMPPANALAPRIGWEERLARIAGGGTRNPYFEIYGRRYSSPTLSKRRDLVGQKVAIWIRHSDSRVEASYLNGEPIRDLQLTGRRPAAAIPLSMLRKAHQSKNRTYVPEEDRANRILQGIGDRAAYDALNQPHLISDAGSELHQVRLQYRAAAQAAAAEPVPQFEDVPDFTEDDRDGAGDTAVLDVVAKPRTAFKPAEPTPARSAPPPAPRPPGQPLIDFSQLRSRTPR